jgi:hypothetical protein
VTFFDRTRSTQLAPVSQNETARRPRPTYKQLLLLLRQRVTALRVARCA